MRCSDCGSANSPLLRFCERCGAPLPEGAPPAVVVCPRCGAANPAGLRFCEQCGAALPAAVPAAARRSRRRIRLWLLATAIILPALFLAYRLLFSGPTGVSRTTGRPAKVSQEDALQRVTEVVAGEYPQFAGSTPDMEEIELGPDKGYRLVYRRSEVNETGAGPVEFNRTLVVGINAVNGEISVAVSQ